MDKDNELHEFIPGILETREQLIARREAVLKNPLRTMSDLASVGMDGMTMTSLDYEEEMLLLREKMAAKEAERNKAIAEAVRRPDKE